MAVHLSKEFYQVESRKHPHFHQYKGVYTALQLQKASRRQHTLTWTGVFPFVVAANDRGAKITEGANSRRQRLTSFSTKVHFSASLSPTAVSVFAFFSCLLVLMLLLRRVEVESCQKAHPRRVSRFLSFFHSVSYLVLSSLLFIKVSFGRKKQLVCRSALLVFNKSLLGLSACSVTLPTAQKNIMLIRCLVELLKYRIFVLIVYKSTQLHQCLCKTNR